MEHIVFIFSSLDVRALLRLRILLPPPHEDEGSVFLRNVGHPLLSDVVSYTPSTESSTAPP